jgi:hypothetical protein
MPTKRLSENRIDPRTFRYTKAQKQQILSAVGLTEDDPKAAGVLKTVTATARVYLHVTHADTAAPLPSELKSQVSRLLGPAQTLHRAVQKLRGGIPFPLDVEQAAAERGSFSEVLDRLEPDLVCVIRAAKVAKLIRAKKPHNRALDYLIQELGEVYLETTGRGLRVSWDDSQERCRGRFFDFFNACLRPIYSPHSEAALCQAIRRALEKSS